MILKSKLPNISQGRIWIFAGCVLAALAVSLGAIGAHLIEGWFESNFEDPARRLELWETAVRYQMYHAIALIGLGLCQIISVRFRTVVGGLMLAGVILFSGCLYGYAVTDIKPLVHIVPMGGILLIVSWTLFAGACLRTSNSETMEQIQ